MKNYSALFLLFFFLQSCQNTSPQDQATSLESTTAVHVDRSGRLFQKLSSMTDHEVMICAHRGFHTDYPENSIASIQAAIDEKIEMVEIDIRTTKDSVMILMHDDTIDRTTNKNGSVRDMNLEEIRELKLLHLGKTTDQYIPTLEEVLDTFQNQNIFFDFDIKDVDVRSFVALLQKYQMIDKSMVYHDDQQVHQQLFELAPQLLSLPICEDRVTVDYYLKQIDPIVLHYNDKSYRDELLEIARENGVKVFINALWDIDNQLAAGNAAPLEALLEKSPGIIQTDFPDLLSEYLKNRDN